MLLVVFFHLNILAFQTVFSKCCNVNFHPFIIGFGENWHNRHRCCRKNVAIFGRSLNVIAAQDTQSCHIGLNDPI